MKNLRECDLDAMTDLEIHIGDLQAYSLALNLLQDHYDRKGIDKPTTSTEYTLQSNLISFISQLSEEISVSFFNI